jgi:hypothetical protein
MAGGTLQVALSGIPLCFRPYIKHTRTLPKDPNMFIPWQRHFLLQLKVIYRVKNIVCYESENVNSVFRNSMKESFIGKLAVSQLAKIIPAFSGIPCFSTVPTKNMNERLGIRIKYCHKVRHQTQSYVTVFSFLISSGIFR